MKGHDIVLINSYARGSKVGGLTWAQKLTNPSTVYLSYYPCFIHQNHLGNLLITRFQTLLRTAHRVSLYRLLFCFACFVLETNLMWPWLAWNSLWPLAHRNPLASATIKCSLKSCFCFIFSRQGFTIELRAS